MLDDCTAHHDWFTTSLSSFLCFGLVISYLPQLYRIVHGGSSEGFSPWFLLLGSTSSAAGFLNMVTMQWRIVKCCPRLDLGSCLELTLGIIQVGLQWFLFNSLFVLYMIYYPSHLKYTNPVLAIGESPARAKNPAKTGHWKLSIALSWITVLHFLFSLSATIYVLYTYPSSPDSSLPEYVSLWAKLLGVSSATLAAIQYAPQLMHTFSTKLVGALSIPMMCLQTPGGVLMVLSIALRPSTDWTSWITFAVAAVMQGCLLLMCIAWTFRQRRLGIDEFGNPLPLAGDGSASVYAESAYATLETASEIQEQQIHESAGEETPLLGRYAAEETQRKKRIARILARLFRR